MATTPAAGFGQVAVGLIIPTLNEAANVAGCRADGIAKARVAQDVGRTDAISSACAYVRRVLPIGVLRNIARSLHGDLTALVRVGAIVAGLAFTVTGFLKIRWTRPVGPPHEVGSTLRNFHAGGSAAPVGYHPAIGQPPGQHVVSGPAGRHS